MSKSDAGKGDDDRTSNFRNYWNCELWDNLEKAKKEKQEPLTKVEEEASTKLVKH